ncbi:MAG: M3 family oligoendopeptidase, partial [Candidatus Omnitrophica bacterium]|nr:M3 family oligoendopeptidase [Candidatus Omnitrophota bacterium]
MASTLLPPRESSEFKRSYIPDSADLGEWSRIEPILQDLCSRPLSTQEELERWLADLSEAQACIEEEESRRAILYTCQTDDPEREKAHLQFIEEITPQLKPCWDRMN